MSQTEASVVQDVESVAHQPILNIVKCMRFSAMMLELADANNPTYNNLNQMQAGLLRAAAKDLTAQYETQLVEIKRIAESFIAGPAVMDERTSDLLREFFEKERNEPGSL